MVLVIKTTGRIRIYLNGEELEGITKINQSVDACLLTEDRCNGIYVYEGEFEVRDNIVYGK